MEVRIGHKGPIEAYVDPATGDTVHRHHPEATSTTTIHVDDSYTPLEALTAITHPAHGHLRNHASGDVAWVESNHGGFAEILSWHTGAPVGRPDGWVDTLLADPDHADRSQWSPIDRSSSGVGVTPAPVLPEELAQVDVPDTGDGDNAGDGA